MWCIARAMLARQKPRDALSQSCLEAIAVNCDHNNNKIALVMMVKKYLKSALEAASDVTSQRRARPYQHYVGNVDAKSASAA